VLLLDHYVVTQQEVLPVIVMLAGREHHQTVKILMNVL